MFDTLKRDTALCALAAALMLAVATPSFAQPTDAQKDAVKSACRSDFMAHCSSVQPGGEAALQCLAKNMSSLSSGCASAVKAIEASAAPKSEPAKTEAAPAAASKSETAEPKGESKPAATTSTAKKPTDAQVSAIRTACRSDYPKVCAGVPTGGAPALECLEKNKAKVSASCGKALAAAGGGAAPAAGGSAPAAAGGAAPAATTTVIVLRPMLPREELFVMRSACGGDIRTLCAGVAPGGGRIMQCVANRAADLSPACKDVLVPFMAR
jgi:cysteine rich repeat protein